MTDNQELMLTLSGYGLAILIFVWTRYIFLKGKK